MEIKVNGVVDKLMEEIKESLYGSILSKLEEQETLLNDNKKKINNLSTSTIEDIEKLNGKLSDINKELCEKLDELKDSLESSLKNARESFEKTILENLNNILSKEDLEENNQAIEKAILEIKKSSDFNIQVLRVDIFLMKNNIENIQKELNDIGLKLNEYIEESDKKYNLTLKKLNSFEETLEYLSLPFYKRLFGRKK